MITSGLAQAYDELAAMVAAAVANISPPPPTFPITYEDVQADLPASGSWGRLSLRVGASVAATLPGPDGRRVWHTTGTVTLQIFTPDGDGLNLAHAYGTLVVNALRGARTSPGGVLVRDPRPVPVGSDGAFFQTNVQGDFEYDEVQ